MASSRKLIRKISIHRFRSFSDIEIDADLLNIYSGKNNAGKSNILKALNLFFNGRTSYDTDYNHGLDYNISYRGAAGGKREIKIEVFFEPTGNGALRHNFSVVKHFIEGQSNPVIEYKSEDEAIQAEINNNNGNITRQFTAYLNKIEYIYIPAIRDKKFIRMLLLNFEQIIKTEASSKEFVGSIEKLSEILAGSSVEVGERLKTYLGINAKASLSSNITDVLGATRIQVFPGIQLRQRKSKKRQNTIIDASIDLFSSGDGIVMSYLVYFLAYLTNKNNKNYIWGYEEPENSLEYSKVQKLAREFKERFVMDAQIFITTHSPAFINLKDDKGVRFYRVYQRPLSEAERKSGALNRGITFVQGLDDISSQMSLLDPSDEAYNALNNELNLAEQALEIEKKLRELEKEKEASRKIVEKYKKEIHDLSELSIFTEGNNITHLKNAIEILHPELLEHINFIEGIEGKSGKDQLLSLIKGLKLIKLNKKILVIFDSDVREDRYRKEEQTKNIRIIFLPKNEENKQIGAGIENMYHVNYFDDSDFIIKENVSNNGHNVSSELNKAKFLSKIIKLSRADRAVVECFVPVIEEIKKYLS